ncbi:MAG: hypothetical protein HYU02_08190, partial [Thaumarchaeota archaeon]|nr:hypothetical protein [Nitrososphaerota archaeon]
MQNQVLQVGGVGETVGLIFLAIIIIVILRSMIKLVKEYERAVIFRLGRLLGAKGPGVFIIIPF